MLNNGIIKFTRKRKLRNNSEDFFIFVGLGELLQDPGGFMITFRTNNLAETFENIPYIFSEKKKTTN